MTTFRPLLIAWACILGLLAGTAVALQFIGPLPPGLTRIHAADPPPPAPKVVTRGPPARALPSSPDPVPTLRMTLAQIPAPDPSLQETVPEWPGRTLPITDVGGRAAKNRLRRRVRPRRATPARGTRH